MSKILYIDTETTGLDKTKSGLTELACIVEINGVQVDKLLLQINTTTYNKDIAIEDEALTLTGKTKELINSYPTSKDQFEMFIDLLDQYIDKYDKTDKFQLNGYNTNFDIGFIQEWFKDNDHKYYGSYFNYKELDVFALVKYLKYLGLIDTENDKLETICNHFGIELDAHNALDDIVATKKLHELLTQKYIVKNTNCENCIYKDNDVYLEQCGTCSSFYGNMYEAKTEA
jgi:DNA polymerase-3 subunit epsilon